MPWRLKHVPYPDDPTTGYRADAPAKVPVDLAVIGDSYTYGFEVDQDRTWVEVLKRTTGLNAVNLAVTSYGTSQEADLFRLYGKSFKPKAVLQVIATNDPLDDVYYNEFNAKKDPRLSNLCWHMGLPQPSFVCDAATRLMKSSILGCLAVFQIQARVKRNYNKEGMTRGTEMICADAKAVKEEARRGGAKYAAALIGFWGNPGVAPYRARLDACLAREGIPVLFLDELAESRRRGRPFFGRFDLHWNDEGHAFVASRVKEFLEGLGWFKGLRRPA
jgi:hypothetical protein